jgi:uncharacterized GH25 family protein
MLKKKNELTKDEKILLLKTIASGELETKSINKNTRFAFTKQEFFEGLALQRTDKDLTIICLGEALETQKMNIFDVRILNDEGTPVLSMKKGAIEVTADSQATFDTMLRLRGLK